MRRQVWLRDGLGLASLLAVLAAPSPLAGSEPRRISVTGQGTVEVKPDVLEMALPVSGSGVLASDALTSFRQAQARTREAVQGLKLEGLSITSSGVSLSIAGTRTPQEEQLIMQEQLVRQGRIVQPRAARGSSLFQETLIVRLSGLARLTDEEIEERYVKLSDGLKASKAAGVTSNPLVFRLDLPDAGQEQALERALSDGRAHAERMARLLGVRLGKVVRAQELGGTPLPSRDGSRTLDARVASGVSQLKIRVTASVALEYEILD